MQMRQNVDTMVQTLESEGGGHFRATFLVGTREPEEREHGNEVGSPVQDHLVFTTILQNAK